MHACMESRQTVLPTSDIKMQKDYADGTKYQVK
jgi:hypothetical protein